MHELGIAESILDAVRTELAAYPGAMPIRVGVKVGVMAAVDADALRFCFEIAVKGTEWSRLALAIRIIPGEVSCLECGHRMLAESTVMDCEQCGSANTMINGSDELDMDFLEVERDGKVGNDKDRVEAEGIERESADSCEPAEAI